MENEHGPIDNLSTSIFKFHSDLMEKYREEKIHITSKKENCDTNIKKWETKIKAANKDINVFLHSIKILEMNIKNLDTSLYHLRLHLKDLENSKET